MNKKVYSNWIFITLQNTSQIIKKLVQGLSISHGDLHYKSYLHRPPMSDRQPNKEVVRINSLEHSPRPRQASKSDLQVSEYPAGCTQL